MPDKTPRRRPRRPRKDEPFKVTLVEVYGDDISPEAHHRQQEALRWFRDKVFARMAEQRRKHEACPHAPEEWSTCPLYAAEVEERQQTAPPFPKASPPDAHYIVSLQDHPEVRLHSATVCLGTTGQHLYTTPQLPTKPEVRDLAYAWLHEHEKRQQEPPPC